MIKKKTVLINYKNIFNKKIKIKKKKISFGFLNKKEKKENPKK